jgi:hypothetical protein
VNERLEEPLPPCELHWLVGNDISVNDVLEHNGKATLEELWSNDWDSEDLRQRVIDGGVVYGHIAFTSDHRHIINLLDWDYEIIESKAYDFFDSRAAYRHAGILREGPYEDFHFYETLEEGYRELVSIYEGQ